MSSSRTSSSRRARPIALRNPSAESSTKIVLPLGITAAEAERELILKTLEKTGHNKAEAARQLGLDVKTMASRVRENLYLCGEILDVDGKIGGYNFQWAWASGFIAGST